MMNSERKLIVGLDMSIKRPGWAVVDMYGNRITSGSIPTNKIPGNHRLKHIYEELKRSLLEFKGKIKNAYIEGPSLFSKGKPFEKGKPSGIALLVMSEFGFEAVPELTPTQVKKYFAGKGNAEKSDMVSEANKRFGLELTDKDNDEADAIAVACVGLMVEQGQVKLGGKK